MRLLEKIKSCQICEDQLPHSPRPVVSFSAKSKIVIVGQAPGAKVHKSGVPWDDASGERLRDWLGVGRDQFYDSKQFALVPMGFCYPGKGSSGDLPPRPECAEKWMRLVLTLLKKRKLIVLVGQYSQNYFLTHQPKCTLTEKVRHWESYGPDFFVLPHPSPRNNIWLKRNSWFQQATVPALRKVVTELLLS